MPTSFELSPHRNPEPTLPAVTPARITRAEHAAESYRKVESEIFAITTEEVGRVTTDVAQAASIALGALPNLLKRRGDFEVLRSSRHQARHRIWRYSVWHVM